MGYVVTFRQVGLRGTGGAQEELKWQGHLSNRVDVSQLALSRGYGGLSDWVNSNQIGWDSPRGMLGY